MSRDFCYRNWLSNVFWRYLDMGVKLRSHMRGAVTERRRADFDIPAPLPRVCSHIRGADAGGSVISWGRWWIGASGFEAGAVNWVLDPFLAERFLLPLRLRSATAHMWTHVMICVEANFPPAPARVRPRMCERTFNGKKLPFWFWSYRWTSCIRHCWFISSISPQHSATSLNSIFESTTNMPSKECGFFWYPCGLR